MSLDSGGTGARPPPGGDRRPKDYLIEPYYAFPPTIGAVWPYG